MTDPAKPQPPPTPRAKTALPIVLVVVAALGFAGWSEAVARDRTLHVLNFTTAPTTVRIDGGAPIELGTGERVALPIAEGEHRAEIDKAGQRSSLDFLVRTPFLSRLVSRPVFVLNLEGAAPLVQETATYGEGAPETDPVRPLFGVPFIAMDGVDLAFAPFPDSVKDEGLALVTRTRVDLLPGDAATVLARLPRSPAAVRFDWAELRLTVDPHDEPLLAAYRDLVVAEAGAQRDRCLKFLEAGLERRPVNVPWHRAWQDLLRSLGREEEARTRVAALLEATPDDAGLLYLAGRLEPEAAAALARYEAALAKDPTHAWALHGRSFALDGRGQLEEALRSAREACARRPDDAEMQAHRDDLRLALGLLDELKVDLERALETRLSINAQRRLLEVHAAKGDLAGARACHEAFAAMVQERGRRQLEALTTVSRLALADLEGDADALLATAATLPPSTTRAAFELAGRFRKRELAEASALVAEGPLRDGPRYALLIYIAWRRAGDEPQAEAWRGVAAGLLAKGTARERWAAGLLAGAAPPAQAELDRVAVAPAEQAILYAALGATWPAEAWLLERAERACHGAYFPTWWLRESIPALRQR